MFSKMKHLLASIDLHLDGLADIGCAARGDHQIAPLNAVLALHDLPDRPPPH
jgi:hypothetical protein